MFIASPHNLNSKIEESIMPQFLALEHSLVWVLNWIGNWIGRSVLAIFARKSALELG